MHENLFNDRAKYFTAAASLIAVSFYSFGSNVLEGDGYRAALSLIFVSVPFMGMLNISTRTCLYNFFTSFAPYTISNGRLVFSDTNQLAGYGDVKDACEAILHYRLKEASFEGTYEGEMGNGLSNSSEATTYIFFMLRDERCELTTLYFHNFLDSFQLQAIIQASKTLEEIVISGAGLLNDRVEILESDATANDISLRWTPLQPHFVGLCNGH